MASDGASSPTATPPSRVHRRHRPQQAHRGHGGHARRPAATGWWPPTVASSPTVTRPSTGPPATSSSTSPSWAWKPRPTGAVIGSSPPTVASSPSATRPSTGRPGNLSLEPTHRRAWTPRPTAGATGWWPPTAASSPSVTPPSTGRRPAGPGPGGAPRRHRLRARLLDRPAGRNSHAVRRRGVPGSAPVALLFSPVTRGSAVLFAFQRLGKPYIYGGNGPVGYDCSGLALAAWTQSDGIGFARVSDDRYHAAGVPVSIEQPRGRGPSLLGLHDDRLDQRLPHRHLGRGSRSSRPPATGSSSTRWTSGARPI